MLPIWIPSSLKQMDYREEGIENGWLWQRSYEDRGFGELGLCENLPGFYSEVVVRN
jgi:hypothetical protein